MLGKIFATVALVGLVACHSSDAELNRRVLIRLAREPTPSEQLTVTTQNHVVHLHGVVHTEAERERLGRAAREVDGVAHVDNELVIEAPVELTGAAYLPNSPTDELMKDDIRTRLDAQELDDIAVEVKNGTVTLRGIVPKSVHDAALQVALEAVKTDPTASIVDEMRIGPP